MDNKVNVTSSSFAEDIELFSDRKEMLAIMNRLFVSFYKFGGICSYKGWTLRGIDNDNSWELYYKENCVLACGLGNILTEFELPEGMSRSMQTKMVSFLIGSEIDFTLNNLKKREIRQRAYDCVYLESRDMSRVEKVLDAYFKGELNKVSFYDKIRIFTKPIKSDHAIKRWQIIADWFYEYLFF